mgnify:FL=1
MNLDRLNPYVRRASLLETDTAGDFRTAPDARCFFSLSGDLAFEIEGEKKKHLTPGNFLYLPAGTVYKLKSKYFRAVVLNFDLTYEEGAPADRLSAYSLPLPEGAVIRRTEDAAPFDRPLYIEDMAVEKDAFLRMANLFVSALGDYRATVSALLKLELLRVAEITDENALPTRMVEAMDEYIREHCGEELSNTEIGAIFGYHPFYVSQMLKKKAGITLHQYIIAYRLKAARSLLENTGKTVIDIADETGFTDASYFTKMFKASYGVTPKEFRNSLKEEIL